MDLQNILLQAHSGIRWLVVVVTLIALVWMAIGLLQKRAYGQGAKRIMLAFSGVITIQWLLGLVVFLVLNSFSIGYRWEHAVIMTLATGLAHMHQRWKNAADSVRYRNSLLIILIVLMLVFIGVTRLPQGWMG